MSDVDRPATLPAAETPGMGTAAKLAIAAIVLAVIAVTVLAVVMQRFSSRTDRANSEVIASYLAGSSARAAETAAISEVRATLTYNYKTLTADFANAEKGMTPTFRANYAHTTTSLVAPVARKQSAISTADVSAAGVSSAAPNAVTVLVFANQTVQNTLLAHPRLDRTRIKVSMLNLHGTWLIDSLIPL